MPGEGHALSGFNPQSESSVLAHLSTGKTLFVVLLIGATWALLLDGCVEFLTDWKSITRDCASCYGR